MSAGRQRPGGLQGWAAALFGRLLAMRALRESLRAEQPPDLQEHDGQDDPSERHVPSNRRAETIVAVLLCLAGVFGFGFTAAYVTKGTDTQLLGIAVGGGLAFLAVALVVAGKLVVPQETQTEARDVLYKEDETEAIVDTLESAGDGVTRRGLIVGAVGLAGAGLVTAAVTPLASLGPDLDGIHATPWKRGVRLVDDKGRVYSADEIVIGSFYTALPEHADPDNLGSALIVVRLPEDLIHLPRARQGWAPEGILAYSKICPHAACAISLYRYPTYQPTSNGPAFTCPCHYSTFLPGEGGRVVFGPAGRSLPQLALMIDSERNLRAADGFHEDIGPSWWDVRRSES